MTVLDLVVERPAAGGRMIARHEGIVVLVSGAIPGERVRAEVERTSKHLIWAKTVDVLEASPSRRAVVVDPACGGLDYAHIAYPAQCTIKSDVVVDAFRRIGKITPGVAVSVEPSPEHGYRLRARLHVEKRRAGFFREGTHVLCDAAATRQLLPETMVAVERTLARLGDRADDCVSLVVSENIRATERVLHLETRGDSARRVEAALRREGNAAPDGQTTGITTTVRGDVRELAGRATVTDTAADVFGVEAPVPPTTTWTRGPMSFFQGNRYATGALVRHVLALAPPGPMADLYAGVGLFAVAFAARGDTVVAVEGDRASGGDLEVNAAPYAGRLRVVRASVEAAVPRLARGGTDTVVVDPPRTGLSPAALRAVVDLGAPRLVYVSCDPATLARDAAALVAAGYHVAALRAFDLFPNTAHIETVAAFSRDGSSTRP